jgi:hypothetical protein
MAANSGAKFRFPVRAVGALALAGAVAVASVAVADPIDVALVESLTGNSPGVEHMDYVRAGQVIRLAPHQTIELSYMSSCLRETITGGTVTIGTGWSEVQSGVMKRTKGQCDVGKMVLTSALSHIGGRTLRGGAQ